MKMKGRETKEPKTAAEMAESLTAKGEAADVGEE
jgi:hypothetical protein